MSTSLDLSAIPLPSLTHLINIKLTSTNYLTWQKQVQPVLDYLGLFNHIDPTSVIPSQTITTNDQTTVNPEYTSWKSADQKVLLLLNSTLSEEAMAETIGHSTALQVWKALADAYSHCSIERVHNLQDSLRTIQKGTSSVSEFGRKFKALTDQQAAIGHPVSDEDKRHYFLCGLGASFENFSTSQRTIRHTPTFRDLLANAENQEMLVQKIHNTQTTRQAAFYVNNPKPYTNRGNTSRGRGRHTSSNRGRSTTQPKRTPHCQLCRTDGHYASTCPQLASFAKKATSLDANLAEAFLAQCNIAVDTPDWTTDSGPKNGGSSS
ncbi:putative RNA-directed DNA polymerase [Helianthus annuus]|nr:putative RNA-directed DNA polymerase [Helianthus annuus]KAJ0441353.1 putative RNA-directed DNA polymerase [Helianthus annuus]KAJ0459333.1 putative RNA-directed DNA polymerase [Helianthus annuus]